MIKKSIGIVAALIGMAFLFQNCGLNKANYFAPIPASDQSAEIEIAAPPISDLLTNKVIVLCADESEHLLEASECQSASLMVANYEGELCAESSILKFDIPEDSICTVVGGGNNGGGDNGGGDNGGGNNGVIGIKFQCHGGDWQKIAEENQCYNPEDLVAKAKAICEGVCDNTLTKCGVNSFARIEACSPGQSAAQPSSDQHITGATYACYGEETAQLGGDGNTCMPTSYFIAKIKNICEDKCITYEDQDLPGQCGLGDYYFGSSCQLSNSDPGSDPNNGDDNSSNNPIDPAPSRFVKGAKAQCGDGKVHYFYHENICLPAKLVKKVLKKRCSDSGIKAFSWASPCRPLSASREVKAYKAACYDGKEFRLENMGCFNLRRAIKKSLHFCKNRCNEQGLCGIKDYGIGESCQSEPALYVTEAKAECRNGSFKYIHHAPGQCELQSRYYEKLSHMCAEDGEPFGIKQAHYGSPCHP